MTDDQKFEDYPLKRSEYIAAMVHFYRGELGRANDWRLRLDTTTNWAVVCALGTLSFAFGTPDHSHASIVMGMMFTLHFLMLEARRFRFFDVWRHRVRMVEENFYGAVLRRDLKSNEHRWGGLVATDLLYPTFKMSYFQAMRLRLLRNYWTLFTMLLLAWPIKLDMHPGQGLANASLHERMAIGAVPWYVTATIVAFIYILLLLVVLLARQIESPHLEDWSENNPRGTLPDF